MGRGRVWVPAIGANGAVHHELERARDLIPMDGCDDHDPMGRDPAGIEVVHPIVDLPEVMIRVTGTRPITERHRGGDAGFAGMNLPAVFRRQA